MAGGGARLSVDYSKMSFNTLSSARTVVPLVMDAIAPRSVVEIGCGIGTWLAVFREHGVDDVLGVDGDYVYRKMLQIPEDRFLGHDLRQPLRLDREFDLAVSLGVAEHLPPDCAATFVATLTGLAPAVLFSAAIPYQGGEEEHHLNEQWPDYWAGLFDRQGYGAVDCIRWRIWESDAVDWWYAQSTLLFVERSRLETHAALKSLAAGDRRGLRVVHPNEYTALLEAARAATDPRHLSLRQVLSLLPVLAMNTVRRRTGRGRTA